MYGNVFTSRIHDKNRFGQSRHVLNAEQILLQFGALFAHGGRFFFTVAVNGAVFLHVLQTEQFADALTHGLIIGQGAAQPARGDVVHAAPFRFARDGFLGLAFGAYKEHMPAICDDVAHQAV